MLIVVIGTRAQLIKMAPVLVALERAGTAYQLILTGQHHDTMVSLLTEFGIATPSLTLYHGAEVTGIAKAGWWFPLVLFRLVRALRRMRRRGASVSCVVVHGDTFSTLIGALAGKLTGMRVAHVESGLRSFNLLHPFPEEITRLLTFRLTDVAFCPGSWAAGNMAAYKAVSIDTGANTLLDALRHAMQRTELPATGGRPAPYCVVSIHRFENIFRRRRLLEILGILDRVA